MKLTEKVYLVGGAGFCYSPTGDCNIYLVVGGNEYAIIDTGGGNGVQRILKYKKMGLDLKRIKIAILTHCHFDHIGSNHDLKRIINCSLSAHEKEVDIIENLGEYVLLDMAKERGLIFESESIDSKLRDGDV